MKKFKITRLISIFTFENFEKKPADKTGQKCPVPCQTAFLYFENVLVHPLPTLLITYILIAFKNSNNYRNFQQANSKQEIYDLVSCLYFETVKNRIGNCPSCPPTYYAPDIYIYLFIHIKLRIITEMSEFTTNASLFLLRIFNSDPRLSIFGK